jgi:putative ABC transport system permease protein
MLLNQPSFTSIAVITLALGIGANTSIFSVVHAVLLKPLPYHQPDRLVMLWHINTQHPDRVPTSPGVFLDWRERQDVFEDIAAYEDAANSRRPIFYLLGGDVPEKVRGSFVSVNLFSLLGAKAALGRTFSPTEEQPGHDQVALMSDALWHRRFGADPKLPGKTVRLSDKTYTIIGIMPPEFKLSYPKATDLWTPLSFEPKDHNNRSEAAYKVIARLKPGVTLDQARSSMSNLAHALGQEYPKTDKDTSVMIVPLHEELFGVTRTPLLILVVAVGLVLLIACVNIVNLLLARTTDRVKEIAVRIALGAGRWRLVRQLLTESVLLSLLGGTLGVLLAFGGRDLLVSLLPATLPRGNEVRIDRWVLGFTFLLSLVVGMAFSLAPTLRASKLDLNETLKAGTRSATASLRARHLRGLLVVSEVALALVLLVGAGLMIRSLWRLQQVELGFQSEKILTLQFTVPPYKHWEEHQEAEFIQRVLQRIKGLPGVLAVASTTSVPLQGVDYLSRFEIIGEPSPASTRKQARWRAISPDYFRTLGIRLVKGRHFTEQDGRLAPRVAIVSETMARQSFASEEPLGKRLRLKGYDCEIVGVVGDVRQNGLGKPIEPAIYEPVDQSPMGPVCLVMHVAGDPLSLSTVVQQAVQAEDKDQPVENISTMGQIVAAATSETKFYSFLLGMFALVALVLGVMGIYGVMSYTVTQRTHEIGIRMALGAQPSDVLKQIMRQGLSLTLLGVVIGLVAAFALTRLMAGLLFGVSATDPTTLAVTVMLLTGVALFACYFPARRATKVDPIVSLRYE